MLGVPKVVQPEGVMAVTLQHLDLPFNWLHSKVAELGEKVEHVSSLVDAMDELEYWRYR